MERPGQKLVVVPQLQTYQQHPTARHVRNAVVAKRGALSGWDRGPVLAPWPTRELVGDLASGAGRQPSASFHGAPIPS